MSASPTTPSSPKPVLKGAFTVKIVKCVDLEKKRLLGKMDPYVKINVGGSEKFKTKTHEGGDKNPNFEQTFLFNLTGLESECDLHVRVYDACIGLDTYIGRLDQGIMSLLSGGGGNRTFDLSDPENFRKTTGHIEMSFKFEGTGGPAVVAELAPIAGPFHFQHNMSGFLVHPTGPNAGASLVLAAGGLNDQRFAFEFQGGYLRALGSQGLYITASPDASHLSLIAGISEQGKFRWTGLGLQHVSSSKIMHPQNDQAAANAPLVLASGSTAASGFSLVPCTGQAPMQQQQQQVPVQQMAAMNMGAAVPMAAKQPAFDLNFIATWPACVSIKQHPHPLFKKDSVYKGTYNCDICALQGQGIAYHCEACGYDVHPACAHKHYKH